MTSSFFIFFLTIIFHFILCQNSPNYQFFLIVDGNQYAITMENNLFGNEFSSFLIDKQKITISFLMTSTDLYFDHNTAFPPFQNYKFKNERITFSANTILECNNQFILVKVSQSYLTCYQVAHFDQPNYPSSFPLSITFQAKEIITEDNEDENEDDNGNANKNDSYYIVIILITIISIVFLIILYILILLLYY